MNISNVSPKVLEKMQKKVQDLIAETGSVTDAAEQLSVNKGTISFVSNGDFANVGEKTFNSLKQKLNMGSHEWGNYAVRNLSLAVTMAMATKEKQHMAGLVAYTGAGKTHSLSLLSRKEKNVFYVLADTEMTKIYFLKAICKALGMGRYEAFTKAEMINQIVRQLSEAEQPLLIIDDAGKLSDVNMRMFQIIYDRTEFRSGILLAGMPYLKDSIERKATKDVRGFKELKRRIAYWEELKPISEADVTVVCEAQEISDEGAIKYLFRECKDFGTLRNMIGNVQKLSAKSGEAITNELLVKMNKGKIR